MALEWGLLRGIGGVRKSYFEAKRDAENLIVRTSDAGQVVECGTLRQEGKFIKEGTLIATIASGAWVARTLATAEDLAGTTPHVGQQLVVRANGIPNKKLNGTVTEVAVTGPRQIDEAALTQLGGGAIPVVSHTMTTVEPYVEIAIELDDVDTEPIRRGMTARVRFDATVETIGVQLYRSLLRFANKLRT